jgi:hypothetical protein
MQTYARVITDDPTDKELDYWSGKRGEKEGTRGKRGDRSNVSVRLAKGCCEMAYFRLNRNGEKRGQVKCIRSNASDRFIVGIVRVRRKSVPRIIESPMFNVPADSEKQAGRCYDEPGSPASNGPRRL